MMKVRPYLPKDASDICAIYNHYITHTTITFETSPITPAVMHQRLQNYARTHHVLVGEVEGKILGYAYASPYRQRPAYQYSTETSVYLKQGHGGCGYGRLLYETLLDTLTSNGFHTAIAGIALPNEASLRLHEKLGFQKVAHFAQVGRKFDQWIDVGFWQRLLTLPH